MGRTVLPAPGRSGEAYFFHGAKYARIKFRPSSPEEEILYGPTDIAREWKTRTSHQRSFSQTALHMTKPGNKDG